MTLGHDIDASASAILAAWERDVVSEVPELQRLTSVALADHLPAFIQALGHAADGEPEGEHAVLELAVRHAESRHAASIELSDLVREYATLRRVIGETVQAASSEPLVRLHAAIDRAIAEAARAYSRASDHVRETFIGILAHDLRDPLTAVMMSANLLADSGLGEKQIQLVDRVTRGARRIERMIDDVLDFARTRLGATVPLERVEGDMGEIVGLAVEEARVLIGERQIRVVVTGDLRGTWDRARVVQALGNLLSNARLYGRGVIDVTVLGSPHAISTAVINQGSAIPPPILERIFDPFARGEAASPRSRRGLGLGLYIVAQIAKAHGGTWRAESADERTTFTIDWPRA